MSEKGKRPVTANEYGRGLGACLQSVKLNGHGFRAWTPV